MKELVNKKGFKIGKKIVEIIFAILFVLFIMMVCLQRFSNNRVSFFNLRMFTVVSGSMEPKYKVGDVLIAKQVDPSTIKVGDDVSYLGNKGDVKGKVITHQVIDINTDVNGKKTFKTKGINNDINDIYPVSESQIYGVITYKVKILSMVYKIVGTTYGLFICVILPLLYIIGSEIISVMLDKEEKRRQKI